MENKMATPCISKVRNLCRNITLNVTVKDHFAIIAGGGKIILKMYSKTVFEGVDCVHMTQDIDR